MLTSSWYVTFLVASVITLNFVVFGAP